MKNTRKAIKYRRYLSIAYRNMWYRFPIRKHDDMLDALIYSLSPYKV